MHDSHNLRSPLKNPKKLATSSSIFLLKYVSDVNIFDRANNLIIKVKTRSGVMFVKTEYFGQRTRGRPRRCEVTAFKRI